VVKFSCSISLVGKCFVFFFNFPSVDPFVVATSVLPAMAFGFAVSFFLFLDWLEFCFDAIDE